MCLRRKTGVMQFWKENRLYLLAAIVILILFYFDDTIITWVRDLHNNKYIYHMLVTADPFVNFIGDGLTQIVIILFVLIYGRFFDKRYYGLYKPFLTGFVVTGAGVQLLKHLVGRGRPSHGGVFTGPTLKGGFESFPSGHTAEAFCLAYLLSGYFPKYRIIYYLAACLIAFERIEDLHHFPSDVMAGALAGLITGRYVYSFYKIRSGSLRQSNEVDLRNS
ncbi:PAP2 superfamily protein [bacterium BMS3Abin07]|nr:PAP2 superfamily protein [bacterium BMS3Abin07]GBE32653.1 PAP2 superfamily protein [bacterium BMS3Bbin05]HDO23328.1 phosphatase PAP2 family protein [Nitrospirota bacterium]HDZ88324.1 phosphatase PAP2 family protein [Nitrospirota bacterium]